MPVFVSKIWYIVQERWGGIVLLTGLFIGQSLLDLVGIVIVFPFLDVVMHVSEYRAKGYLDFLGFFNIHSSSSIVIVLGGGVLLLYMFKNLSSYFIQRYTKLFVMRLRQLLVMRLYTAYLYAPYSFFSNQNNANLVNCVALDVPRLAELMAVLLGLVSEIFLFVLALVGLLIVAPKAVFVVGVMLSLVMLLYRFTRHRAQRYGYEAVASAERLSFHVTESLGCATMIKLQQAESYFIHQLRVVTDRLLEFELKSWLLGVVPRLFWEVLFVGAFVVFVVGYYVSGGDLVVLFPMLSMFGLAVVRLMPSLVKISTSLTGLRNGAYLVDKVHSHLKEIVWPISPHVTGLMVPFEHQLTLKEGSFTYSEGGRPVFEGIDLVIPKDSTIGIIGKSGGGKTTLVNLLLGLLTPTGGDILVDGVSILSRIPDWQMQVGYVPQFIHLLDDTLENNIIFGSEKNETLLREVIAYANLSEVVAALPDKTHTHIGQNGVKLSGGQRQRLGIARALYKRPSFLVFDEATSALDHETENAISDSILSLKNRLTIIIVAHRYTTLKSCDAIYCMEKGAELAPVKYLDLVSVNE